MLGRRSQGGLVSDKDCLAWCMVAQRCSSFSLTSALLLSSPPCSSGLCPSNSLLPSTLQNHRSVEQNSCMSISLFQISYGFSVCHQAFWLTQHFGTEPKLQRREKECQDMVNFPLSGKPGQRSEPSWWYQRGDKGCCWRGGCWGWGRQLQPCRAVSVSVSGGWSICKI